MTSDADVRMIAADAAIATAQMKASAIAEALKRLDARGEEVQNSIRSETGSAIEAEARIVVRKFGKALRDAASLSGELTQLQSYGLATIPVAGWRELSSVDEYSRLRQWLDAAAAAGWEA